MGVEWNIFQPALETEENIFLAQGIGPLFLYASRALFHDVNLIKCQKDVNTFMCHSCEHQMMRHIKYYVVKTGLCIVYRLCIAYIVIHSINFPFIKKLKTNERETFQ